MKKTSHVKPKYTHVSQYLRSLNFQGKLLGDEYLQVYESKRVKQIL